MKQDSFALLIRWRYLVECQLQPFYRLPGPPCHARCDVSVRGHTPTVNSLIRKPTIVLILYIYIDNSFLLFFLTFFLPSFLMRHCNCPSPFWNSSPFSSFHYSFSSVVLVGVVYYISSRSSMPHVSRFAWPGLCEIWTNKLRCQWLVSAPARLYLAMSTSWEKRRQWLKVSSVLYCCHLLIFVQLKMCR